MVVFQGAQNWHTITSVGICWSCQGRIRFKGWGYRLHLSMTETRKHMAKWCAHTGRNNCSHFCQHLPWVYKHLERTLLSMLGNFCFFSYCFPKYKLGRIIEILTMKILKINFQPLVVCSNINYTCGYSKTKNNIGRSF